MPTESSRRFGPRYRHRHDAVRMHEEGNAMRTPDDGGNAAVASAGTSGRIDIKHEEAREVGRNLECLANTLKNTVQGGNGSAYGLQHWHDLLGDVLVLDGDLRGMTGGLQRAIMMVIEDMYEASRVAEECGKGLRIMSDEIKKAEEA